LEKQVVTNLQIRDARPEELDEVSQLLKSSYQQYEKSLSASAWRAYLEDIMDVRSRWEESQLIVAELGGQLAGCVTLYLKSAGPSMEGRPPGWAGVRLLAVHPTYRGRGIGRALMDECIRRCRQEGITTLGLHTTRMMDVARRMYEKMGFKRVPEFDFYPRPGVAVMAYYLNL
jgi:ribosomal protein S18 acetylase RimI-like enzyme